MLLAIMYILECIYILKKEIREKNYITFNSIFLTSFFFVSYAFAAFIAGSSGETILSFLIKRVDLQYLTKAVALSHLAINCYFLGFTITRKSKQKPIEPGLLSIREKVHLLTIKEHYARFIYFIVFIGVFLHYLTNSSVNVTESPFLYDIYRCILLVAVACSTLKSVNVNASVFEYCRKNILYISTSFIFILLCLIIGDRGPAIYCTLIIVGTYLIIVKRINGSVILLSIITAATVMFAVRMTRGTSQSLQSGVKSFTESASEAMSERASGWDTMADLTGIFAEMTVGYERVQQKGIIYPMKIVLIPLYPFPFAPSIFSNVIFNKSHFELSSVNMIGQYAAIPWSNGTHSVIDIYIFWGLPGVIILFFLFGYFIKSIYNKLNTNIYCVLLYIMLIGMSLYLPRSSLFDFIRPMTYTIVFAALIIKPLKQKGGSNPQNRNMTC